MNLIILILNDSYELSITDFVCLTQLVGRNTFHQCYRVHEMAIFRTSWLFFSHAILHWRLARIDWLALWNRICQQCLYSRQQVRWMDTSITASACLNWQVLAQYSWKEKSSPTQLSQSISYEQVLITDFGCLPELFNGDTDYANVINAIGVWPCHLASMEEGSSWKCGWAQHQLRALRKNLGRQV